MFKVLKILKQLEHMCFKLGLKIGYTPAVCSTEMARANARAACVWAETLNMLVSGIYLTKCIVI